MQKYKIAKIIILIAIVYFLLIAWCFILIKKIHANFETSISNGNFEAKINWTFPIPKLKNISFPSAKIEQVKLKEDKTKNKNYYSLEFKLADKFNRGHSENFNITLMSKEYDYAQNIKNKIEEALQNQKEFKCEIFSFDFPEFRKIIVIWFASAIALLIVLIIVIILEKKEKKKINSSNIKEKNNSNNINNSIMK